MERYKLAVYNTHPIQYFAPLYRRLAEQPDIDLTVYYGSRQGVESGRVDPGFGKEVVWDVPLLDGYRHEFLANVGGDRGVNGFFAQVITSIASRIRRGGFDALIVHGHNSATTLMAVAAAKASGTRVLMRGETHLLLPRSGLKAAMRGPVMSAFYKMCDACLYIGALNRQFYEAHGVPSRKLFFVPYTVDNDRFSRQAREMKTAARELRRALGLAPSTLVVLFASKFIARKRPLDLIEAFGRNRDAGIDAALVLVGSGELEDAAKRRVEELGLTNVRFAGFVNQAELAKYLAMADLFALPSENEPWGLVVNEAMAAGLPVMATREIGAAADLVIDGRTGFAFDRGDVARIAQIVATLARDRALRASLAEGARARMRDWSYEQCVEGVRAALLAGGPPRAAAVS